MADGDAFRGSIAFHCSTNGGSMMLSKAAAVLVIALLLSTLLTPAHAETKSFTDGRTTAGPMDIHRVTVANEKRLAIRVRVADLQRKFGRQASAWIDTDPGRPGPEFVITSGLWESDWQIGRARDWRMVGPAPLNCPVGQRLFFDRDIIRWTTGKACLGRYGRVRVSIETARGRDKDYSPSRHRFHDWVARG